jgi:DNA helicase II / ATP-dependent DNA helicase PcrA
MYRIFGPPGTGKTTMLLNKVNEALEQGIHPNEIAFLAFTKKASTEARERASSRFNLDPKTDLIYFRTLHSLALMQTSIKFENIMSDQHYRELSQTVGITLNGTRSKAFDEDLPTAVSKKDPILGLINLARLKKTTLRDEYNKSSIDIPWNTIDYIDRSFLDYKHHMGLYDFTDMLEVFIKESANCCPKFKVTFLDEAQDLSPLQWDLAHILDKNSERMYCAGDDDQAIYRWAGADVDQFISLDGGSETLEQSYRIPSSVHTLAENVAKRIHRRFPKTYLPRAEKGSVERINSLDNLDFSHGNWLILSQAGYHLQSVASDLKSNGYLFNYKGNRSIGEKLSNAVNGWEQLRKGKEVSGAVARKIYSYMSAGKHVQRGFKKLPLLDDAEFVTLDGLIKNHGLLAEKQMIWSQAMDKIPETDRAYVTALLRRGEKFNASPRITVSTIHGSKGGEADNVVLLTDLSPAAENEMHINPDDMHRVFYVGVTRARQNLYIVDPEDIGRSYNL